jgi:DNA-binding transcriptional MerR regulator
MGEHTINELSALTGLPVRTIRYYLAQGLIPSAGKEGPATRYPEATLARLRLITRLRDAHLPLAEIRKRLDALTDEEVVELTATPAEPGPTGTALDYVRSVLASDDQTAAFVEPAFLRAASVSAPHAPLAQRSAIDIPASDAGPPPPDRSPLGQRSQWERVSITPDIELHLRRPLSRRDNRMVERLIAFARQLQGEDKP